jgi:uncharacterized protein
MVSFRALFNSPSSSAFARIVQAMQDLPQDQSNDAEQDPLRQDTLRGRIPLIDGFSFAETGRALRGGLPLGDFTRLQDLLSSKAGELRYEVLGTKDDMGRAALRLKVSGALQLTCQRCLKAMEFALDLDELLVLARSEAEIEAQPVDPEGPDRIVGGKEMAVGTLLEDEILLAIPFAPRHSQCSPEAAVTGGAHASPFADLRGLLNQSGRADN